MSNEIQWPATLETPKKPQRAAYVTAFISVAVAAVLRLVLEKFLGDDVPYLLLFAAVLLSASMGGLGPGLLATFLAALSIGIAINGQQIDVLIDTPSEVVHTIRFLIEGLFISVLGARLQSAKHRAEQSEAEARRLEQKILDISDDERRRIGQDLHDGLGQHLTGVAFLSKALQQRLTSKALPEAEDATKIATLVSESIGQTRALARGLSPVGLEQGGLSGSLIQLTNATAGVFGIRCNFHPDERIELNNLRIETHLYRIAQEAINNAIRHGKATAIDIWISTHDNGTTLSVEDNGVGFGPKNDHVGLGLQIMHFRAKMIDGTLNISRREKGGTTVACTIPTRIENGSSS